MNVRDVFQGTFTPKVVVQYERDIETSHGPDPLDELAVDDSKAYKLKISKYIKNSLSCVQDPDYWFIMWVANHTHGPLLHFYRFLCVKLTSGRLHIVELVARRIDIVMGELNELAASADFWIDAAFKFVDRQGSGLAEPFCWQASSKDTLRHMAVALFLQNAAVFDRRVARCYQRCRALLSFFLKFCNVSCIRQCLTSESLLVLLVANLISLVGYIDIFDS